MTRQTSREAYRSISESGALSRARWLVYDVLFHHGPLTRNEIDARLRSGSVNPSFSRRLVELERIGVIARNGVRACSITGFNCDLWDVTANLPVKVKRAKRCCPHCGGEITGRRVA